MDSFIEVFNLPLYLMLYVSLFVITGHWLSCPASHDLLQYDILLLSLPRLNIRSQYPVN